MERDVAARRPINRSRVVDESRVLPTAVTVVIVVSTLRRLTGRA